MAQRYYTGTKLKTLLSGDKVLGRNLIKKARAYTGYLFDQLTENQKYRTQRWNGPNGSKIQVFVWRDVLGERALARIYHPIIETLGSQVISIIFENGIIGATNQVYISPALDSYFGSSGTQFLPENVFKHIQGEYLIEAPFDWSTAEFTQNFTLGTDTSYISLGHPDGMDRVSSGDFDPDGAIYYGVDNVRYGSYTISSCYTGLMRRAVQAKLARGTDFTRDSTLGLLALFPWGMGPPYGGSDKAYKHDGLLRAPDYTYFVVRVTDSGAKACRMITDPNMEDLRSRLANGSFSGDDEDRIESLLLSSLQPNEVDGEIDEFDLFTEWTGLPEDTLTQLAYGWHYSYPPLFECAIVRHTAEYFETYPNTIGSCTLRTAYKTTISFEFEWDALLERYDLTASDSTEQQGDAWKIFPDATVLWVPDPYMGKVINWYSYGCGIENYAAPLYGWYTEDGYQDIWIKVAGGDAEDVHVPPLDERNGCDCVYPVPTFSALDCYGWQAMEFVLNGGASLEGFGQPVFDNGAWSWVGRPAASNFTTHESTYSVEVGPTEAVEHVATTWKTGYIQVCPSPIYKTLGSYSTMWIPPSASITGTMKIQEFDQNIESGNYVPYRTVACVIPRLNSEAVVLMSRTAKTLNAVTDYGEIPDTAGELSIWWYTAMIQRFHDIYDPPFDWDKYVSETVHETGFYIQGQGSAFMTSGGWSGAAFPFTAPPGYLCARSATVPSLGRSVVGTSQRQYSISLHAKAGEVNLLSFGDGSDWDRYFNMNSNLGVDPIAFSCMESLTGDLLVPDADAWNMTMNPSYDDDNSILALRAPRWIGFA